MKDRATVVDVHSHVYPLPYIELLEARDEIPRVVTRNGHREFLIFPEEDGPDGVGGREMGPQYWELEQKIAFMDSVGIDVSVVSLGNPWLNPFPTSGDMKIAEQVNHALARLEHDSDGRVVAMGVLAASSPEAAASSASLVADIDGLHGVISGPSIAGLMLDDPRLDQVWDTLVKRRVSIFFHPENGVGLDYLQGHRHTLPVGVGFPLETTIALSRLVFGGVLDRFPDLRILVAHGGGTLPYLAGRMDAAWQSDSEVAGSLSEPPSAYLRKLWLDALVYYGPALQAAAGLVGNERLMFGTDDPFTISDPRVNLKTIRDDEFNVGNTAGILGDTARSFFGIGAGHP